MPKETANRRRPYAAQACTICRARKSKCDGVKPVCGSCGVSGRDDECSWGRDAAPRTRTEAHFEALRKRTDALQAYTDLLEGILAKCTCQDVSSHLQFRPQRLEEQNVKEGAADSDETDVLDSDEEITHELTLDDKIGGLLLHGITSPFRFGSRPPNKVLPRNANVIEDPHSSYVLLVDGVCASDSDLNIDWSRHLPPEVAIDRQEHDRILDLSFKFFTMWCLRVVPPLFLRDMHRALSVPRSQRPPRTPHYSPMLHNALLSLSAIFSDDPYIRDPKTRQFFANTAKECLEAESQKPDISFVNSLAFLGTYYADLGDRILGDLYFGMCSRMSLSLGLSVDSKAWVKSGLIAPDEMLARNWAHWSVYSMDVCWALYFGRDFSLPPLNRPTVPMPFVDSEYDQIPWHHAPANIPPQPNYLSLTFFESSSLFGIAREIIDILTGVDNPSRPDVIKIDENVTKIDLQLNNWRSRLPPQLNLTPANRAKSTPQRLMLHCEYWWCFIVLHRPFLNRRAQSIQYSDREIDHVKLCKRAAENVLELLETWSSLYTLRYAPVTLLQVIFSAGTIFLLLALQATASHRVAHGSLKTALTQVEQCVRHLHEMGQAWQCAARTGDILAALLQDKLKPVIARRLAHKGIRFAEAATPPETSSPAETQHSASELQETNLLPADLELPASYTPYWNSQNELGSAWSQTPLDFLTQSQDDAIAGFLSAEGNIFPELDTAGFLLPTFDFFGAPELWDQNLFAGDTDRSNPPHVN
ncbi:fungal-specific transcription factor domain-containing protein [Mycena vulgaris]|nr:fungal-specific transcription factor domain-containing protein [Mycena vulgaris]